MLKVAPVSTKYLSLVSSSERKRSPTLAGKCIAMAVACAGMAAKPEGVRRQLSFLTKHRAKHTCEPCWRSNCVILCTHVIARVLERIEIRAGGGGAAFGTGVAVPFVASPPAMSRGGRDRRFVAALNIPQGVRGLHPRGGYLVVVSSYRFSHGRWQANEKHGQKQICVWRNSWRQLLFELPHENAGLQALHCHGEAK